MPLFLKVFLSSGIRFVQNLQRCLADICRHRKEIKFTRLQTLRQQTKYTFLTITQAWFKKGAHSKQCQKKRWDILAVASCLGQEKCLTLYFTKRICHNSGIFKSGANSFWVVRCSANSWRCNGGSSSGYDRTVEQKHITSPIVIIIEKLNSSTRNGRECQWSQKKKVFPWTFFRIYSETAQHAEIHASRWDEFTLKLHERYLTAASSNRDVSWEICTAITHTHTRKRTQSRKRSKKPCQEVNQWEKKFS